jgi:hypothetical protein
MRCVPMWFFGVLAGLAVAGFLLGQWLKPPAPEPPPPSEITLRFYLYFRDGTPFRPAQNRNVWIVKPTDRGTPIPVQGAERTQQTNTRQLYTLSSDRYLSSNDFSIEIAWRTTEEFLIWLENDFITQNNLDRSRWQANIESLRRRTRGKKQHYPIILPDLGTEFWESR